MLGWTFGFISSAASKVIKGGWCIQCYQRLAGASKVIKYWLVHPRLLKVGWCIQDYKILAGASKVIKGWLVHPSLSKVGWCIQGYKILTGASKVIKGWLVHPRLSKVGWITLTLLEANIESIFLQIEPLMNHFTKILNLFNITQP